MQLNRVFIRRAALWLAGFPIGAVAAEFCVAVANELGLFTNALQKVAFVTDFLSLLVATTWFHWVGGGVIGFAVGVWLDAFLRKRERTALDVQPAAGPAVPSASVLEKFASDCERLAKDLSRVMADNQPFSSERTMHSDPKDNWELTVADHERTFRNLNNQIRRDHLAEFVRLSHMAIDFGIEQRTHEQLDRDLLENPGEGVKWVFSLSRYSSSARIRSANSG